MAWVVGSYVWVVWADLGGVDDGVDVIGVAGSESIGSETPDSPEGVEGAASGGGSGSGDVFGVSRLLSVDRLVFFGRVVEVLAERFGEELGRWVGEVEVVPGELVEVGGFVELGVEGRDLAVIRPPLGGGFGLVCSDLGLALSVVELLCGGSGKAVVVDRPLSRLEVGVFDLVLSPLVGLVVELFELGGCEVVGHVSGLSAVGDVAGPLVGVSLRVRVGEVEGLVVVGLPAGLLGGFVADVDRRIAGEVAAVSDGGPCVEIVRAVRPVSVELVAGFDLLRVPAGELVGLRVGDVIRMGQSVGRPLVGRVGEQRLFQLRPGARGQRLVAEVTGHLSSPLGGVGGVGGGMNGDRHGEQQ